MTPSVNSPIRVVLLDSSPLFLKAIERVLSNSGNFEVVGSATNGRAGLALIESAGAAIIVCSTGLSLLSSTELVAETMSRFATPILVVQPAAPSDCVASEAPCASAETMAMLAAGATDWVTKPAPGPQQSAQNDQFLLKLARTSRVSVFTRHRKTPALPTQPRAVVERAQQPQRGAQENHKTPELIAIGASTGGPPVLLKLLSALDPQRMPPILCIQHISHGFLSEMVDWLNVQCRLEISIANGGEIARAGTVYFPAEDHHLEISSGGRLSLNDSPPLAGHRPSVNKTFSSIARSYGPRALALLLTGMGADGATGLQQIHDSGGATWVQTPASCVVAGMPVEAIELGAAQCILTPDEMVTRLTQL